jgi:hypothetical protein
VARSVADSVVVPVRAMGAGDHTGRWFVIRTNIVRVTNQ